MEDLKELQNKAMASTINYLVSKIYDYNLDYGFNNETETLEQILIHAQSLATVTQEALRIKEA